MKNKQKTKSLINMLISLFLLVVTVIGGRAMLPAFADTSSYTSVLEDLQKDSNFNVYNYPDKRTDDNMQVIQVAESVNGELFVYTYLPCQETRKLDATCINMSLTDDFTVTEEKWDSTSGEDFNGEDGNDGSGSSGSGGTNKPIPRGVSASGTRLYNLTLIDRSGVFGKYVVEGFTVSSEPVRYYNVTSIYRENYSGGITLVNTYANTVNEVACPVGKVWKATTTADGVKYEMKEVETVTITNKYVGTVCYPNGVSWFTTGKCDSHFVAFSTNKQIDTLLEANVYYISQTYDKKLTGIKYGNEIEHYVSLSSDQTASNKTTGLFGKSYTWKRIQSVSEFSTTAQLDNSQKSEISGMQWVLNFAETDYLQSTGVVTGLIAAGGGLLGVVGGALASQVRSGTFVTEVSILRLKFVTNGVTYNLGVVDNKQTGDNPHIPSDSINGADGTDGKFNFWAFLGNCFKSLLNKPAWWQIAVVVIVIILTISAFALFVWWLKWLKKKLKGE